MHPRRLNEDLSFFSSLLYQKIVSSGDSDKDEQLDFVEFSNYLQEHEKKLNLTFKSLDKNNDGKADFSPPCESFNKAGLIHVVCETSDHTQC